MLAEPKKKRQIKINALTQAKLIHAMLDGVFTCQELADVTGLHYVTVLQYCRELHRAGAAFIKRREPDARGRHIINVYQVGHGRDAPRVRQTQAQRQQRVRDKREQMRLAAVTAGKGRFVAAANGRLRFEEIPCPA